MVEASMMGGLNVSRLKRKVKKQSTLEDVCLSCSHSELTAAPAPHTKHDRSSLQRSLSSSNTLETSQATRNINPLHATTSHAYCPHKRFSMATQPLSMSKHPRFNDLTTTSCAAVGVSLFLLYPTTAAASFGPRPQPYS